ncbi:unnamed protein product [Adineta steineri]|uniref:Cytochrome P450 n=2 Tax=Adineta steineri TaxID=433720 RepID=A0A814USS2_9BILA|nr:unnamed protein product [Adineta steineri]
MFSVTFAIVLLFFSIVYYYFKSKYFTLHGPIPGIPPHFMFGNLLHCAFLLPGAGSIPDVFLYMRERFGDVYQLWLGSKRMIMINCLEDAQHIFSHRLIYDQGDVFTKNLKIINPHGVICLKGAEFKRHASFTAPLFRRAKILVHFNTITECTDKLLDRWRTQYKDPNEVHLDMIEQSQQLLLGIFGFIAFDYDLQTLEENSGNNKHELTEAFHSFLNTMQIVLQLPTFVARIFWFLNFKARRARTIIDRYVNDMIEHELNSSSEMRSERKRTSFIASLVISLQVDEKAEGAKPEEEKKGLSRVEVMSEMIGFLGAGYGTTSTSLIWFIYFMSKNPQIQNQIKKELAEYNGQRISHEQLDSLVYLECVLRELLRLVGPALGTVRTLTTDDKLPASGFELRKGESVMISFYALARDKRYWSDLYDLNEFHPERFLYDTEHRNNLSALMAFGGGHRQCMGQDLARLELKLICARLMQFVSFGDGGNEVNSGGYDVANVNKPKKIGVTVRFD